MCFMLTTDTLYRVATALSLAQAMLLSGIFHLRAPSCTTTRAMTTSQAIFARRPSRIKGDILLRQDSRPSSGSGGVFGPGIIRRDPETLLVSPPTTRIQGRIIRTGTEGLRLLGLLLTVHVQSVHSHTVTSSPCS